MSSMMCGMLLGAGVVSKKTYVDDVFSTYLWKGNGNSGRTITNNIDVSGEGALVWMKSRSTGHVNVLFDTERGANQRLRSDSSLAQNNTDTLQPSFTSSGFTVGSGNEVNGSGNDYTSWTFRKAPGFFDIVQYSGNSVTNRQISHNLGSNVGMVMIKCLDSSDGWAVWHRDLPNTTDWLALEENWEADKYPDTNGSLFGTSPARTSTYFTVGFSGRTNQNGQNYIAYVFAGGESITDKAVEFDGTNDYLTIPDNDDWNLGNTFTLEAWVNLDVLNGYNVIISQSGSGGNSWYMSVNSNGSCQFYDFNGGEQIDSASSAVSANTWTHIAIVANSGTAQWYVNGTASGSSGSLNVAGNTSNVNVGAQNGGFKVNGEISNLRLTKGQALYTSNFAVPDQELTRTSQGAISSNVKLLCCNGSSATSSTVTPDTISATGSPSVTTNNSIFDDPAAFTFGDSGDQTVIKCGSYVGAGGWTTVDIGWQPQWVIVKRTDSAQNWFIWDTMRGWFNGSAGDKELYPNLVSAEYTYGTNFLEPTSTGFRVDAGSGMTYVFVALRNSDGYVGKPPELGTDVFAMDVGDLNSTGPIFDSTFPVDFATHRDLNSYYNWFTGARLMGAKYLRTNGSNAESSQSTIEWDFNNGWQDGSYFPATNQSWMWKRHKGFDVVAYNGTGATAQFNHSLSQTPEMVWIKPRTQSIAWTVLHSGLSSNTKKLELDSTATESNLGFTWSPTSTHFNVNNAWEYNRSGYPYLAVLFCSVSGISKIGSFTGNGSSAGPTITTGFSPRFILLKNADSSGTDWVVLDTLRDLSSSADEKVIYMNDNDPQYTQGCANISPTGFSLADGNSRFNGNGDRMIYYAHA